MAVHERLREVQAAAAEDATKKSDAAKTDVAEAVTNAASAVSAAQKAMTAAAATPSRIRARRVVVPSMAIGASQVVQVTWDTPFPSTSYTVPCPGVSGSTLLSLPVVSNITKEGCTITVKNAGGLTLAAGAATLHILAIHDPLT